ncbi:hypothetical protein SNOG_12310 [Parastagonospora nodorum SN15]|uniref:Uncharacterized protein n=1 Tax=Phaeosphaeria nodorum (strain SN15 / ATCC MYA-4574 / FGSC 10173) TaxID=321614 RepID=Q0U7F4_PHANO|nr:hypothetical protein SNOG_12310 [Parastagonospora nodorum SN15]EAT80123.1 hypothetical protein SNOG_12310 [Parastagonospora nodorum SN15]
MIAQSFMTTGNHHLFEKHVRDALDLEQELDVAQN